MGEERVFALSRSIPEWKGGQVAWLRGSLPYDPEETRHLPERQSDIFFDSTIIIRYILSEFGYSFLQNRIYKKSKPVLSLVSRYNNAFNFSGYKGDTTSVLKLRFPQGAPLMIGLETLVKDGMGYYSFGKAYHYECRAFVKQRDGIISCRQKSRSNATQRTYFERNIEIYDLDEAEVTIFPPLKAIKEKSLVMENNNKNIDWTDMVHDTCILLENISGTFTFAW